MAETSQIAEMPQAAKQNQCATLPCLVLESIPAWKTAKACYADGMAMTFGVLCLTDHPARRGRPWRTSTTTANCQGPHPSMGSVRVSWAYLHLCTSLSTWTESSHPPQMARDRHPEQSIVGRAPLMLVLCCAERVKKASRARSWLEDMRATANACATTKEFMHAPAATQSHIVEMLRPTQQDTCAAPPHWKSSPVRH